MQALLRMFICWWWCGAFAFHTVLTVGEAIGCGPERRCTLRLLCQKRSPGHSVSRPLLGFVFTVRKSKDEVNSPFRTKSRLPYPLFEKRGIPQLWAKPLFVTPGGLGGKGS